MLRDWAMSLCLRVSGKSWIHENRRGYTLWLAERGGGLKTEQIAEIVNRRRLHVRRDGQPVTSAQVYAVVMRFPDTFVKAEGRIMLMI